MFRRLRFMPISYSIPELPYKPKGSGSGHSIPELPWVPPGSGSGHSISELPWVPPGSGSGHYIPELPWVPPGLGQEKFFTVNKRFDFNPLRLYPKKSQRNYHVSTPMLFNADRKILVVGAGGKMAAALLPGLRAQLSNPSNIIATGGPDWKKLLGLQENYQISIPEAYSNGLDIQQTLYEKNALALSGLQRGDILLLAAKPPVVREFIRDFASIIKGKELWVVSIAAGLSLQEMQGYFGSEGYPFIIRSMPNLPILIDEAVITYTFNENLGELGTHIVHNVFRSPNICIPVESDDAIDDATAVAGSGPAYYAAIAELLINAMQDYCGLSPPESEGIILAAVLKITGSLKSQKTDNLRDLLQNFSIHNIHCNVVVRLSNANVIEKIKLALAAAYNRSQELGGKITVVPATNNPPIDSFRADKSKIDGSELSPIRMLSRPAKDKLFAYIQYYFLLLMQASQEYAIAKGFSPLVAEKLSIQTAYGTACLAKQKIQKNPSLLGGAFKKIREETSSPNGTTVAAITEQIKLELPEDLVRAMLADPAFNIRYG
jgi:pyrroline-5-carboxylate reductase